MQPEQTAINTICTIQQTYFSNYRSGLHGDEGCKSDGTCRNGQAVGLLGSESGDSESKCHNSQRADSCSFRDGTRVGEDTQLIGENNFDDDNSEDTHQNELIRKGIHEEETHHKEETRHTGITRHEDVTRHDLSRHETVTHIKEETYHKEEINQIRIKKTEARQNDNTHEEKIINHRENHEIQNETREKTHPEETENNESMLQKHKFQDIYYEVKDDSNENANSGFNELKTKQSENFEVANSEGKLNRNLSEDSSYQNSTVDGFTSSSASTSSLKLYHQLGYQDVHGIRVVQLVNVLVHKEQSTFSSVSTNDTHESSGTATPNILDDHSDRDADTKENLFACSNGCVGKSRNASTNFLHRHTL